MSLPLRSFIAVFDIISTSILLIHSEAPNNCKQKATCLLPRRLYVWLLDYLVLLKARPDELICIIIN